VEFHGAFSLSGETRVGHQEWIARLRRGEIVTFSGKGSSMVPRIRSGEPCTYVAVLPDAEAPEGATRLTRELLGRELTPPCYLPPEELRKGDMVFCHVGRYYFTHLLTAIRPASPHQQFQISNNRGHVNGWVTARRIFGLVVRVGG
jgi:hypothetical protein